MIAAVFLAAAALGQQQAEAPGGAPAKAECSPRVPDPNSREIIVCAPKPEGYRIDPDVMAAKKAKRQALAGRPKPPENFKDHSCKVVGPAPCMDAAGINLLAAAATAAEMAKRLSTGQEIGSMFVTDQYQLNDLFAGITDPQTTEYQYYKQAKKEREAKEAAKKAAEAKASAAAAPTSSDIATQR